MLDSLPQANYSKRAFTLVGGLFVLRLIYAALFPESPAGDEAYYWDWGRHLDYGYYSKPPFIAWLYAFVDWSGGGSLFAIRATAAVLGSLSLLFLFRFNCEIFDEKTAWVALLLSALAPANSVLCFFLTIDAPLVLCWSTALWMFWRVVSGSGKGGSLALLFLALAIGHLTKQMMMAFPVLALVYLLLHSDTRPLLRRRSLWLVLLGSYLSLIPPLVWNARNEWITFQHTKHHFESVSDGGNIILERAEDFLSFLATQLGVIGPAAAVVLFPVCLLALRSIRNTSSPIRYLLVFGSIPLAGMLVMALRQELQPNWPAVFYVSCFTLTAAWFSGKLESPFPPISWRRHLKAILVVSAVLSLYFYLSPLFFSAIGMPGHTADPSRRTQGPRELSEKLEIVRTENDAKDHFLVALGHRDTASHLAFGLPDQPKVYLWDADAHINSQYELWNTPEEDGLADEDALIIIPGGGEVPASLAAYFSRVEKVDEFEVSFGYNRKLLYAIHRAVDLQSWPSGN